MQTPLIAKNIDEVIAILEKEIAYAELHKDRNGYFAALYHKVTLAVKDGIQSGQFGNGQQLEKLDVLFANRYLHALQEWRNNRPVSKSWEIAFTTNKQSSKLVLHHLLLGMNAHINLDLGIASVEVANGGNLDDLRNDYNSINTILAALTYSVMNKLNMVSPFLSTLGFSGTRSNSMLVQFSIGNARDGSWYFAEELSKKKGADYDTFIAARDTSIAELGKSIITSSGLMRFGIWVIHLFEWKNVQRIITVLHTHKRLYKSELTS